MAEEITLYFLVMHKPSILQKLRGMITRCENKDSVGYKSYGAKGIKVCSAWKDQPEDFVYWCWENNYFPGCHIHRLNTHKDYEPENCLLCTPEEHYQYHSDIAMEKRGALDAPDIIVTRQLPYMKKLYV